MGKASSAKKVARAARAGGKKTSKQRQWGFPVAIGLIIVLGLSLVAFARTDKQAGADTKNSPKTGEHWHAAFGVYICDRFITDVADRGPDDPLGIHTHADGLVHIHPFLPSAAGKQAKFSKFFGQVDLELTDSTLRLPMAQPFDGRTYKEGETTCGGEPAELKVVHWTSAIDASEGGKPDKTFTSDFPNIRFEEDLGAYTIAFVPKGTEVPPPPGAGQILQNATIDSGGGTPGAETPIDPTGAQTVPSETIVGDTVPGDTAPGDTAPATDSVPEGDTAPATTAAP